jgi:threonyl-tRNA synthetase
MNSDNIQTNLTEEKQANSNEEMLSYKRHTLAHLLASAVKELYRDAKPTLGPSIDNGFYYDFDFGTETPKEEDLVKIEKAMKKLLPTWEGFKHLEISKDEAEKIFEGNPYKLELINEIAEKGEKITVYYSGAKDFDFSIENLKTSDYKLKTGFFDLCRGGHVENPSTEIKADSFKLSRIAGAYWRGNEENKMLTRIYGLAYDTKEDLEKYEWTVEEAKKRDHKKLGKELKLFTSSPLIGAGLPLLQPKGMAIRKAVEDYLWELHKQKGYDRVWTPHIAKEELYITSGHAAKFGDELFRVQGKEEAFIMKPMNCPHHMQIFADNQFSYRDMPVRYFEPATVYRDEKTGQLAGLTRVRAITQDDGHLFCRSTQISEEVSTIVGIIKEFYTTVGLMNDYWVRLSLRGDDKSVYLGSDEVWDKAETALEEAAKENNLNYKPVRGEAAFYGPKLDFMFKDALGREWQLATIQCDFNLPERFDLSFTNEKGEKERPVVIHRAISGSLERFLGIIIEHFAGAFPTWLAPIQVKIIPVRENHIEEAKKLAVLLRAEDIRVECDISDDGFGKKVRAGKVDLIPYTVIIGDKDIEAGVVTLESRDKGKVGTITVQELVALLTEEIKDRK